MVARQERNIFNSMNGDRLDSSLYSAKQVKASRIKSIIIILLLLSK
jgi:hypothetical protein